MFDAFALLLIQMLIASCSLLFLLRIVYTLNSAPTIHGELQYPETDPIEDITIKDFDSEIIATFSISFEEEHPSSLNVTNLSNSYIASMKVTIDKQTEDGVYEVVDCVEVNSIFG